MAGDTENTDILAGINQVIQSVNDLVLSSKTVLNCGGCGTDPPSEPGVEGDPPPVGWEDVDDEPGEPAYESRKCKVANLIHENYLEWMGLWRTYNVDNYSAGSLTVLVTLLGTLIGLLAFPVLGGVIGAILGFYGALALVIIAGGFDLDALISLMEAEEQDLVCALFSSTDASDGKADYIAVLQGAGASAGEIVLLEAAIMIDAINLLYFRKEDAGDIEAIIAAYTPPISCAPCDPCPFLVMIFGTGTLEIGSEITINSELNPGSGNQEILIQVDAACSCVNYLFTITGTTGTIPGSAGSGHIEDCSPQFLWTWLDGQAALIDAFCAYQMSIASSLSFSITMTITEGC